MAEPRPWPYGYAPPPPPSLPESINGVLRAETAPFPPPRLERLTDVFAAVRACWIPPGGAPNGDQITLRMSFKASGQVLGQPRITFYRPGGDPGRRAAFTGSVLHALKACLPLSFAPSLGAAIAGRPFTFRFIDDRAI